MKKLVRALFAILLVIGFCGSAAALAGTPYYIDVLGREVIVPDVWAIETFEIRDSVLLDKMQNRAVD